MGIRGRKGINGMKRRLQRRAIYAYSESIASVASMKFSTVELAELEDIRLVVVLPMNRNPKST